MRNQAAEQLEIAHTAASTAPLRQRAHEMLTAVRRVVPFDSAWLASANPGRRVYSPLDDADLDERTLECLHGPGHPRDIEVAGTNRAGPPLSPSDLSFPLEERRWVAHLAPVLADGLDPIRSLVAAARLVQGATAAVVLRTDDGETALPGLDSHPLLAPRSPALEVARAAIGAGHVYTSFLWPQGGRHAPDGHTRVTAMTCTEDVPPHLTGIVLVSPAGNLRGLTPRELEVLGLLIEGLSNHEIACTLVVAQRTVAAHVEHILTKLAAPTRTLAAVRAERDGLYVPPMPPGRLTAVSGTG